MPVALFLIQYWDYVRVYVPAFLGGRTALGTSTRRGQSYFVSLAVNLKLEPRGLFGEAIFEISLIKPRTDGQW
jgi:hypothetical protein